MKPWEFVISDPSDLPMFADLLEEWGHPGFRIVRHIITNKKFPRKDRIEDVYYWLIMKGHDKVCSYKLPVSAFLGPDIFPNIFPDYSIIRYYNTSTEAIWAIINAFRYLPQEGS